MLTDDARRDLIQHEQLIADVLKIRQGPREKKQWWTAPHVTSTVAAVLTVAVTSCATYFMQSRLKAHDYALARQDLRLTQTRDAMFATYELLSALLKTTDDRAKIATGQYASLSDTLVNLIVDESNTVDSLWRRKRYTAELGIIVYFGDSRATVDKWHSTRDLMQEYANCALGIYMASLSTHVSRKTCDAERQAAQRAFDELRDAMVDSYQAKLAT